MLYYLLTTIYVLSCLVLLLVILLQQGKGGDMASAFGGGSSQAAFGARAGATLLSKLTTAMAVVFMLGALVSVVKLGQMAAVVPGVALYSIGALILILAAANTAFNPRDVWKRLPIERDAPRDPEPAA